VLNLKKFKTVAASLLLVSLIKGSGTEWFATFGQQISTGIKNSWGTNVVVKRKFFIKIAYKCCKLYAFCDERVNPLAAILLNFPNIERILKEYFGTQTSM
jgi:hypothetical protein